MLTSQHAHHQIAAANVLIAGAVVAEHGDDVFLVAWENVNDKLAFAEKTKLVLSFVLTGGAAAVAIAPKAVQLIKSCVANPVCWNEVRIAAAEFAAGDALGAGSLAMSVATGGKLVLKKGDEIVGLIDDTLGRLARVSDDASDIFRTIDGSLYKPDSAGALRPAGGLTNSVGRNLDGFSDVEVGIIGEADGILSSPQMNSIRQAYEKGESVTVVINGRTIQ